MLSLLGIPNRLSFLLIINFSLVSSNSSMLNSSLSKKSERILKNLLYPEESSLSF